MNYITVSQPTRVDDGRTTEREDTVTILLSLWLTIGLFLDGYAHENILDGGEGFVTPWHAVFYAAFAAMALWIWTLAARRRTPGVAFIDALPTGYRQAWTGVILFGLGGAGDAAWHTAFGVETGIDALLSPTHLVLFAGLLLILLSPWRARASDHRDTVGRARLSGAEVWSVALATCLAGFFTNYVWGPGVEDLVRVRYHAAAGTAGETAVIAGVGSILVTTAMIFGAAALILRRGRPPRLWFTVMFTLVAALVSLAFDEGMAGVVAAGLGGVALDVVRAPVFKDRVTHAQQLTVASLVTWAAFFALLGSSRGIEWPSEIWLGSVLLAGLTAFAIGHITTQPAMAMRYPPS